MSRVGNCYDNAVAESFYATLKAECIDRRFATREHARAVIFDYIEVWYNRRRRHSTLGYLSPWTLSNYTPVTQSLSAKPGSVHGCTVQ